MSRNITIITYLIAIIVMISVTFQAYHYMLFMNKGARFTARDGQELCERVRSLELRDNQISVLYPFQTFKANSTIVLPCKYSREQK